MTYHAKVEDGWEVHFDGGCNPSALCHLICGFTPRMSHQIPAGFTFPGTFGSHFRSHALVVAVGHLGFGQLSLGAVPRRVAR